LLSEKVIYVCEDLEKDYFKIRKYLDHWHYMSEGIIKSFDLSKHDIIEVVYLKTAKQLFTWEDIKYEVEEELVHYVKFDPMDQDD
jgi:hypothetical protein